MHGWCWRQFSDATSDNDAAKDDADNCNHHNYQENKDWQPYSHCLYPPQITTTNTIYCQCCRWHQRWFSDATTSNDDADNNANDCNDHKLQPNNQPWLSEHDTTNTLICGIPVMQYLLLCPCTPSMQLWRQFLLYIVDTMAPLLVSFNPNCSYNDDNDPPLTANHCPLLKLYYLPHCTSM